MTAPPPRPAAMQAAPPEPDRDHPPDDGYCDHGLPTDVPCVDCLQEEVDQIAADYQEERPVGDPLIRAHDVFRRWLGSGYDLDALDIILAAAAVLQLDGDPPWVLLLSGSGNAKTETVCSLQAVTGAHITSTISSEGALLSASSRRERSKLSTGGLLRKIGAEGILVIKDVTSILSMNRDARTSVLAALREVADGYWERNVGTDGGMTLTWAGRVIVIGGVTSAWDTHHGVIAQMGDRFVLVRVDSGEGRIEAGTQALRNVGHEKEMRTELAEAAAAVLAAVVPSRATLDDHALGVLLPVANLVTIARTAVEKDFQGNVTASHQPESPTRLAKMLAQIVRGAKALGIDAERALELAVRAGRDSVPPMRHALLGDVAEHPGTNVSDAARRLQKPRSSVDRGLQELHILGLLSLAEVADGRGWRYRIASKVDLDALDTITRKVGRDDTSAERTS